MFLFIIAIVWQRLIVPRLPRCESVEPLASALAASSFDASP
jgi:hypothetical protein